MAGDWVKMRSNLWDDPRVTKLVDLTTANEATVIGALYWLWTTADQHTQDGAMPGLTTRAIDRKTGLQGFADGLVAIGWLSENESGVCLERFDEHNGESAKRRLVDAKRKGAVRKMSAEIRTNDGQDTEITGHFLDISGQNSELEKEKRREELTSKAYVLGHAEDASLFPSTDVPTKPACPHQEIIAIYHEVLPQCPQIRDWTPARATQLRARWNEDPQRQNLDYWRRFFEYVKGCDFLVGRAGATPFFADLEWLTKSANFTKIREEKYANRK